MGRLILWICSATLLIVLPWAFGQSQQAKPNGSVWFVLEEEPRGKLSIDPIGKVVDGKIVRVPTGCDADDPEYKKFEAAYLQPGQTYSVTFGGAPAGIVALRRSDPNFGSSVVEYDGIAKIRGHVRALATDAQIGQSRISPRQAPTAPERAAALKLARQIFEKAGIAPELLANITVENLTRTFLAPSQTSSVIGSFSIVQARSEDETLVHHLFFIAASRGQELEPEFTWNKIASSETDSEALNLIDQASLLADGQDEVIAVLGYYENYRYRVYRRSKDGAHWEQVFETETLGCL
jgi:hypothetical protein